METGELKNLVIQALRELGEASVHELISYIEEVEGREYSYSTIATILSRLEDEDFIEKEKKRKTNRKKTYYRLKDSAHKQEAESFLKNYVSKFGNIGLRHLSSMMGSEITSDEMNSLREKLLAEE